MTNHEQSDPIPDQATFHIFDRASSHKQNTAAEYFLGDGLVARIGWVDNTHSLNLTLGLHDLKFHRAVNMTVEPDATYYSRYPVEAWENTLKWLSASRSERSEMRSQRREPQSLAIPTTWLRPVAQAVKNLEPHTEPEPPTSTEMWQSSLDVISNEGVDVEAIRSLIAELSQPLD